MIFFEIDNEKYSLDKVGFTIIQACTSVGVEIPKFCYHNRLSIAGNCRMCLVELVEPRSLKPVIACATLALNQFSIKISSKTVKFAREGVLEFLLANHPLDCPICDQGGECDLQDQSLIYGRDKGRFYEKKRVVEDKDCGPLIKTVMTRCIHCTRCVRFGTEIAGVPILGVTGRGNSMEIGMYIEKLFNSELSGNVIDLCPVGALTSKPYAFVARPWELKSVETIDLLDSIGSRIRVDVRGLEILRILPSLRNEINEEWINDKTRFCYDGVKKQRILNPFIKYKKKLIMSSWFKTFNIFKKIVKNYFENKQSFLCFLRKQRNQLQFIGSICGNLLELETMISLRFFLSYFNSELVLLKDKFLNENDFLSSSFMNLTMSEIEEKPDFIILIGLNLRLELPLLNLKLRKNYLKNNSLIVSFGYITNSTYKILQLVNNLSSVKSFFEGRHLFCKKLLKSKLTIVLVGVQAIKNLFKSNKFLEFYSIKMKKYNTNYIYNIIYNEITFLNYSSLGFSNLRITNLLNLNKTFYLPFIYFVFSGDANTNLNYIKIKDYIIYFGHNGDDNILKYVDLILPITTCFEMNVHSFNLEGRIQKTQYSIIPPGMTRMSWKIIIKLLNFIKPNRIFKLYNYQIIKLYSNLEQIEPIFIKQYFIKTKINHINFCFNKIFSINKLDFYLSNSLLKSSNILTLSSNRFSIYDNNFFE